jgi:hypothetical protein
VLVDYQAGVAPVGRLSQYSNEIISALKYSAEWEPSRGALCWYLGFVRRRGFDANCLTVALS